VKKYTEYKYLEEMLAKSSLYLGDPKSWPDCNDSYAIELSGWTNPGVACLTRSPDRYHFWTVFGKSESGICLWFNFKALNKDLESLADVKGDVSYPSLAKLSRAIKGRTGPAFIKRQQYKDEREFRVVRMNVTEKCDRWVAFRKTSLKRIYLSSWLPASCYDRKRKEVEFCLRKYGFKNVEVKQNRVKDYEKWKKALKDAGENTP